LVNYVCGKKSRLQLLSFLKPTKVHLASEWQASGYERQILLYIHGYNVNHKDAIKRAAQLKHNSSFPGLVMVYSWPSKGTLWGYAHDEKMIEESADLLHGFIKTILTEV